MIINRQIRFKTNSGKKVNRSEKDVTVEPGKRMSSIKNRTLVNRKCNYRSDCIQRGIDIKVTIETKARTPFFLSGPKFTFVFRTGATQSWVDVMITAAGSVQKSVTNVNCLGHYNVHESVFKTSYLFNKFVPGISREDSILINLNQSGRKKPVLIRIKILTRSHLRSTDPTTHVHLEWASVISLHRGISKKLIGLPGCLSNVTLETLSFVQRYTINIYWISDLFSRGSYQSDDERFCHGDVMTKTKYTYCLNYTSVQNSYIFFWHLTQYLYCYIIPPPMLRNYLMRTLANTLYTVSYNIKCNKQHKRKYMAAKSWTEASNICKSIGGNLPLLRNRDELNEIIAFLKLSKHIPPVKGLYIGLRRNVKHQVTKG